MLVRPRGQCDAAQVRVHWAKEEPIQEDVPAVPDKAKTEPSIQMLRVKPVTPEEMFEVRAKWLKDDR
jgi:hypothetical protein